MCKQLIYVVCFVLVLGVTAGVVNGGGLWGYYPINENDFDDYSGNSHHGTAIDGARTVLDADRGWVAAFNVLPAEPSRVNCGTDDPSADGEVSVSAWIKWEGMNGNWQGMAGKSFQYEDRRWIFQLRDTDGMIQWGGTDQDNLHIFSTVAPETGEWQHVAGTCDGSYSKVYIDGEIVGEGPGGFRPDAALEANVTLGFGEDRDDYDESFNGVMDSIYIYSRTLSDHQVMNLTRGIPPEFTQADNDNPKNGAIGVPQDTALNWKPGTNTVVHDVYFGTVFDDVNDASRTNPLDVLVSEGQEGLTYEIPEPLEFGKRYYWRVDEVNDAEPNSPWKGEVWSFLVINYHVVEDFEDYNDYAPDRIFDTWIDGYGTTTNGSTAGYPAPNFSDGEHFIEIDVVHGGAQSMPYFYDNDMKYSEAARTLDSVRDWTIDGVEVFSLWFSGFLGYVGSFTEEPAGTYTMTASGADIWGNSDEFHFAFKELTSVGSIVAKVESLEHTDDWAKAGVMIRDTLDGVSAHAMMVITPNQGVSFQRRLSRGMASEDTTEPDIAAPQWVRIGRDISGNITASYSADGSSWTQLGSERINLNLPMYIGLAVTAHNDKEVCEAVFSNVSITGTVSEQWTDQDIGIISNSPQPMYVVVGNSTGEPAVVYHEDPNVTVTMDWTEWVIPLQDFADLGIDLTDVDNIAIGIGTRGDTTTLGGSGQIFFDDIRVYLPEPEAAP